MEDKQINLNEEEAKLLTLLLRLSQKTKNRSLEYNILAQIGYKEVPPELEGLTKRVSALWSEFYNEKTNSEAENCN